MKITLSRIKAEYVEQVRTHLADLPAEDVEEIVQDLEAHLAELDDGDLEAELGTPSQFAREFRVSAGLESEGGYGQLSGLRAKAKRPFRRLTAAATRLAGQVRWPSVRPIWIYTRGWLLVGAIGVLYYEEAIRHFPIPSIEYSTLAGLVLTGTATALSVWLDRAPNRGVRRLGTSIYSLIVAIAVVLSIFNPLPDPRTQGVEQIPDSADVTAPGVTITEDAVAAQLHD